MRRDDPFIEIESSEELQDYIEREQNMRQLAVQGLNLLEPAIDQAITSVSANRSYFLGCTMSARAEEHVRKTGGTVFPDFGDLPFNAYRSSLYTVQELMDGYERGKRQSLADTLDGKIYAYFKKHRVPNLPMAIIPALAFRIHDHAIDDAVFDLLYPEQDSPLKVVAIMGGHKMRRDDPSFLQVAKIASRLSQVGYFVTSGGGPGAMEASNLGAYFSEKSESDLEAMIRALSAQPQFKDDHYFETAYEIIDRHPSECRSLAVPTWFYGHEPTNLFASHVAKYFANSIREDGMLAIARQGVIFSPGSAGTIQEIFMDAAQNRYRSYGVASPMIFLGREYWTEAKPVYPLLKTLAEGRPYEKMMMITDDTEEVVRFIREHGPIQAKDNS